MQQFDLRSQEKLEISGIEMEVRVEPQGCFDGTLDFFVVNTTKLCANLYSVIQRLTIYCVSGVASACRAIAVICEFLNCV